MSACSVATTHRGAVSPRAGLTQEALRHPRKHLEGRIALFRPPFTSPGGRWMFTRSNLLALAMLALGSVLGYAAASGQLTFLKRAVAKTPAASDNSSCEKGDG